MSALALSVLLSLVSAVAYAGGAIVQEQVAVSSPGQTYAPLRRPGWWAAVALNGTGGLLHVVALAYGPLSLVQPLGALTIVFALPMAALFVHRRAGATAWRGAIMATVGLAGLLSLVGAADAQSLDAAQRVAVGIVTAGVVVGLMIAARAAHRHPAVRSVLLAIGAGIAFGISSVFTKTVAVDWTGGVSAGDLPSLGAIALLATVGLMLSQAAYRGAGLAAPLATLTVVNPVVAAAVGITMFGETFRYGTTGTALALSCGVVAAGGLILLTTERLARTESDAREAQAEVEAAPETEPEAGTETDPGQGSEPRPGPEPDELPTGPTGTGTGILDEPLPAATLTPGTKPLPGSTGLPAVPTPATEAVPELLPVTELVPELLPAAEAAPTPAPESPPVTEAVAERLPVAVDVPAAALLPEQPPADVPRVEETLLPPVGAGHPAPSGPVEVLEEVLDDVEGAEAVLDDVPRFATPFYGSRPWLPGVPTADRHRVRVKS